MRPFLQTLSNAPLTYRRMMLIRFLSLAAFDIISVAMAIAVLVLLFLMNPCWLFIRRCEISLLLRIFSENFEKEDRSVIFYGCCIFARFWDLDDFCHSGAVREITDGERGVIDIFQAVYYISGTICEYVFIDSRDARGLVFQCLYFSDDFVGVYFCIISSVEIAINICSMAGYGFVLVSSDVIIYSYFIISVEGVVVCVAYCECSFEF